MCITLGLRARGYAESAVVVLDMEIWREDFEESLTRINVLVISVLQFLRLLCAYTVLYPTIVGGYFLRVR